MIGIQEQSLLTSCKVSQGCQVLVHGYVTLQPHICNQPPHHWNINLALEPVNVRPPEKICGRRLIIFAKGCVVLSRTKHGMGEAVVPFQWKGLSSLGLIDVLKEAGIWRQAMPRISARSRERSSANIILRTMLMPHSQLGKISRPIPELKSILDSTYIP